MAGEKLINPTLRRHHKKQGAQAPCFSLSGMQRFPLDRPMLSKTLRNFIVPVVVTLAVGLAVSGCGRKGDIDPPSTPKEQRNLRSTEGKVQPTPERPFILDKLL
ncbi:putative small lipoprotein YifL [Rhizobium skierniewicense]|uniref:Putative small lipoprotein YifL n=2 Tax=Rhizobium skierniewicense TaxID=984260 RepID=A0A7W6CJC7_9HYPH|nr:putative small lipoprotein YifL [Rhizobium skierniewicense]